jgi:hypothetical protein
MNVVLLANSLDTSSFWKTLFTHLKFVFDFISLTPPPS